MLLIHKKKAQVTQLSWKSLEGEQEWSYLKNPRTFMPFNTLDVFPPFRYFPAVFFTVHARKSPLND